ncbi:MAG TPA: calcium-binding protein [Solirubrobacterales bacterium]|nr:calcium-binding protein [Solirubrobacterales bacterium]
MNRFLYTVFFCAAALLVLSTGAVAETLSSEPEPSACRYVQAGPAGLRGNKLLIDGTPNQITLRREGEAILVVFRHTGTESVLECEGPQATVRNIDRVVYLPPYELHVAHQLTLDESGGLLQPGATPEPGGDEIEVVAKFPKEPPHKWSDIFVVGTAGNDWIRIGALRGGWTGVNLERTRDGAHADADLIVSAARRGHFQLDGGPGEDRLAASGIGSEFVGPMIQGSLSLRGKGGNDVMLGGPQHDHARGGAGKDLIYGRGGDDSLEGEEGDDRLYGGPGEDQIGAGRDIAEPFYDFLSGGPGHDALHSIDGNRDKVLCGAGRDQAYVDGVDEWSRATCEKQHGPDFPR